MEINENSNLIYVEKEFSTYDLDCNVDVGKLRKQNFEFIIYPEHYNDDKMEILKRLMLLKIPFVLSPLHDKDIKEDGQLVKPHYHVLILYDSVKTAQQVECDLLNCGITWNYGLDENKIVFKNFAKSVKGTIRYFVHAGWSEKYQYNYNDCVFYNINKDEILLSSMSENEACKKIIEIIENNGITEYRDLMNMLQDKDDTLALFLIKKLNHTIITYLRSYGRELARVNNNLE